jgi:hypothetical protein
MLCLLYRDPARFGTGLKKLRSPKSTKNNKESAGLDESMLMKVPQSSSAGKSPNKAGIGAR